MDVLLPQTLEEALVQKAAHPEAVPIAGGTDLMVELNFDRRRPPLLMDICRLPELRAWQESDGLLFLGSGVTYSRIIRELSTITPFVQASRSVGSPQIRNRGTVGGNLGTASPAGDALPVLAAYDADIVLAKAGGRRRTLRWDEFLTGPKKTAIAPDELIVGARWRKLSGPGSFSKIGPRNAMVIAVASVCLVLDQPTRTVRAALGSVGPTILRTRDAEAFCARALTEAGWWEDPFAPVGTRICEEFGSRVAAAARPIDDVRGTAVYRRHSCEVLAARALRWAIEDRKRSPSQGHGRSP